VSGIRSIKVAYRVIEIRRGAVVARPGQPSADLVGYGKDARHVPAGPQGIAALIALLGDQSSERWDPSGQGIGAIQVGDA
jgi:hypothetical protein